MCICGYIFISVKKGAFLYYMCFAVFEEKNVENMVIFSSITGKEKNLDTLRRYFLVNVYK